MKSKYFFFLLGFITASCILIITSFLFLTDKKVIGKSEDFPQGYRIISPEIPDDLSFAGEKVPLGNFEVYSIVFLRGIFGALFLTLFLIKSRSFSKAFFKESFRFHWKALLISGLVYPFVIYFYFFTIISYGYAIAAFLLYTSGIFVLIFIIITKMNKVSKITIMSFILAIIGVAIIMEFWNGLIITLGLITGILSGLTLAIFVFYKKIIYNKRNNIRLELKAK